MRNTSRSLTKMRKNKEIEKLFSEGASQRKDCSLCRESGLKTGKKTGYGIVVCKIGNSKNGWFAALSPKTGGNPKLDFTIQIMPMMHLTHFSQIGSKPKLGENYGIIFSKVCMAITEILMKNEGLKSCSDDKKRSVPIAAYGKCTTWKEKKEHLHIKIFPFRGNIGQPYTVDSSFERKEVFKEKNGQEFVKMIPVKKAMISQKSFNKLARDLISILN